VPGSNKVNMKIKRLERKDHKKAITFAIEGMNFNKYIDSKIALALYGRYFLYLELESCDTGNCGI